VAFKATGFMSKDISKMLDFNWNILTWLGSCLDHEGGAPRVRPFHCT